ncbi:uncharacterized protein Z519_02416 [Cladophialophora bantiana CBS 173.52]|uniref:F-box domain-containing protein n=1 Tax=Cladophialophora bantiana (strain ATCC 10958 / CBS 173.52 / CDC B-1940 / NIH 8579) TaxID=1442370 RepID=A0A0D2IJU4_CLAB1|nr:uncharacterized protein Z519_02416 [Cladophialophora bantiana CBS 173.52]KIW97024.1 hypothetical protein Z519_02416 [Cladophialophora bantiana CBS 173.52]
MAQFPDPAHDVQKPERLSSLLPELQLEISRYLDYRDLNSVRATSRAMSRCFADPATLLVEEMSRAWVEVEAGFQDRYYVDMGLCLLDSQHNRMTLQQEVEEHATVCGFSKILVQWLVYPSRHHFACSKCRVVKPWAEFPTDGLRRTYPFSTCLYSGAPQQVYKDILESMVCGDCSAAGQPYRYHNLGLRDTVVSIIQCHRCHLIKRAPAELSFKLRFSGFCQQCFAEVNQHWFRYKGFLQECLAKMESYENGEYLKALSWEGLPECPVPADFVAALNNPNYRPLSSYSQIAFAQLSLKAARLHRATRLRLSGLEAITEP